MIVAAKLYPRPGTDGVFSVSPEQVLDAPHGLGYLHVIETEEGWRASAFANLPEAEYGGPVNVLHPVWRTRFEAVHAACDGLIDWCVEQRMSLGRPGRPTHEQKAGELLRWAFDLMLGEGGR